MEVMCASASAAVRKTSSVMALARVSTAAMPMAGKTYALFACPSSHTFTFVQLLKLRHFLIHMGMLTLPCLTTLCPFYSVYDSLPFLQWKAPVAHDNP